MKSTEDEPSLPKEAYYAAPKHRFEKLFDTSESGLREKSSRVFWLLLLVHLLLKVIDILWIKHNPFIDGALVFCIWLIFVTYIWSHPLNEAFRELTPTWRKCVHLFLLILLGFASIMMPVMWMIEHALTLTSFDF